MVSDLTISHQLSDASAATLQAQYNSAKGSGLLPYFRQSARRYDIPLSVLLGVASRETGLGTNTYYLTHNNTGADGHGKGILQIDDRYHSFGSVADPTNDQAYINYGADYLSGLRDRFGSLNDALAAYNAGAQNVLDAKMLGLPAETYTTGGNYASDVLRRAKKFQQFLPVSDQLAAYSSTIIPAVAALLAGGGLIYWQGVRRKK